ncbi:hypothetical protein GCM10010439_42190 [Actinocorallia aurantiaca]|uniref:Uncharacterized protein n=1 Tax=Actinocorallia aurantiaca TaxID=46204 RepID=A0ABN3UC61_9ACTN
MVLGSSLVGVMVLPYMPGGRGGSELGFGVLSPGEHAAVVVLYPLLVVVGLLNACLLGWSGARGLRAVGDPDSWRERQESGLIGLLVAGAASLISAVASPAPGVAPGSSFSAEAAGYSLLVVFSLVGMVSLLYLTCEDRVFSRRGDRAEGAGVRPADVGYEFRVPITR